jgi:hypothetical protein
MKTTLISLITLTALFILDVGTASERELSGTVIDRQEVTSDNATYVTSTVIIEDRDKRYFLLVRNSSGGVTYVSATREQFVTIRNGSEIKYKQSTGAISGIVYSNKL